MPYSNVTLMETKLIVMRGNCRTRSIPRLPKKYRLFVVVGSMKTGIREKRTSRPAMRRAASGRM